MFISAVKITPGCNPFALKCISISLDGCLFFIIWYDKNWHNLELEYLLYYHWISVCEDDTPIPVSKIGSCSGLGAVNLVFRKRATINDHNTTTISYQDFPGLSRNRLSPYPSQGCVIQITHHQVWWSCDTLLSILQRRDPSLLNHVFPEGPNTSHSCTLSHFYS